MHNSQIRIANERIAAYNRAMRSFEKDFEFLLILLSKKKRRKSTHKIFKQRSFEGAHNVLIDRHLMDDDTKFKEYFRLSPYLFSTVLEAIKEELDGIPTNWIKKPINAHQKLCLTLR